MRNSNIKLWICGIGEVFRAADKPPRKGKTMVYVDEEIKRALIKKGYTWKEISIKSVWGYIYKFEIKLDGRLVEVYECRKKAFID